MAFGSKAQQQRFLPRILAAEEWWCQGYSEPGAGSDLASVKTRAELVHSGDGKHFLVLLRRRAMSAAKVVVGQQAVQLHGGMGVTDELDVSHYFKRLMAIELQFGSTDHHLELFADQLA
jgi:alkylation response protein AidB-like acyl-CoA dehydrogenase